MNGTTNTRLGLAFRLFQGMQKDSLEYIYRGHFTEGITDNILEMAETTIEKRQDAVKIKKKIYYIMVECLQNITRHQHNTLDSVESSGIFVIQRREKKYYITTGNPIRIEKIDDLKAQIEKINKLEQKELRQYYLKKMEEGEFSEKGGAGLGLIGMARKSGEKLAYDFTPINDEYSYFYLLTGIPHAQSDERKEAQLQTTLENIKELHGILNQQNILLNYSGEISQNSLISLLAIAEGQMIGTIMLRKKIFYLMVEMMQNITRHAYSPEPDKDSQGIFFLSEQNNDFFLLTGNFILNCEIDKLKSRIDHINGMDNEELDKLYNEILLNVKVENPHKIGLGLIDMRLKSKNKIGYNFHKINDLYSFFSIQTTVPAITKRIKKLLKKSTKDSPEVKLNAYKGIFTITGRSFPENAVEFYSDILAWFDSYKTHPNPITVFKFRLYYFSTSSAQQIASLFLILSEIAKNGELIIKWYYATADMAMLQEGKRFEKLFNLNFEFYEYEDTLA